MRVVLGRILLCIFWSFVVELNVAVEVLAAAVVEFVKTNVVVVVVVVAVVIGAIVAVFEFVLEPVY